MCLFISGNNIINPTQSQICGILNFSKVESLSSSSSWPHKGSTSSSMASAGAGLVRALAGDAFCLLLLTNKFPEQYELYAN